jgi:molybdopterin synthase sulfur carrier subunit
MGRGASLRITVRLYATLREGHAPEESVELPPGMAVSGMMKELKVPESVVTLIFINGRHASPDTLLNEGDIVALFPPIGGG